MTRTNAQILELQATHSEPFAVENILDPEHIKELLKYYLLRQDSLTAKNTGPDVLSIDVENPPKIFQKIIDIMHEKIGRFKVRYIHFFDVTSPHVIHIDDTYNYDKSYKAFTVPLRIYGPSEDIKLCVFDQYYYHGPAKFYNNSNEVFNIYYNSALKNYDQVSNLSATEIDINFKKEYLSHLDDEWLKGLSVNKTLEWKPGNILCFDSLALHCSTDFKAKGVRRKIGLSIFTTVDN